MDIENVHSFEYALRTGINLFIGAGFSVLAKDAEGIELPTGAALAQELASKFAIAATGLALPQIATVIEHSRKDELRSYLTKRFTVQTFDRRYAVLDRLALRTIFTTNIDDLLFKVFGESRNKYLNRIDAGGPTFRERQAIEVVNLHGFVHDDHKPYRFGSTDVASAFASDPDRWHFLVNQLRQAPTIFWGYGLTDAATLQSLGWTAPTQTHQDRWILLHPEGATDGTIAFFRALGFQIATGDTEELLDFLQAKFAESSRAAEEPPAIRARLLDESIPPLGKVPVRPIRDFYLGQAPVWYDIFSGQIHQTAYFKRIRDAVNAGSHATVIGVPACGKTTLLMQVAASGPRNDAHIIFPISLTPERAHWLVKQLQGERALIFLDNFADSFGAVQLLLEERNIQLVLADRDYSFEIVQHLMNRSRMRVLDVSELSQADIQACLQGVPQELRRVGEHPGVTHGMQPSLFEIIESNVSAPTLRARFASVLRELENDNEVLRDLLVMISYVRQCRTPVSMDMLIAFLRDITTDHREISSLVERLGGIVAEYVGDLVPADQDYYTSRSTIVAEAVIDVVADAVLKKMFLHFHANVSAFRICRYDVFRTRAYDNQLATRVFADAQEGREFYEELFLRDRSSYILQHGALYLSKKGRYTEAFDMIDRSRNVAGRRIWAINNSYAIILFRANIDHHEEEGARETLQESMAILTECYTKDRRKPFHALTFADQALRYWKLRGDDDEDAHRYLETARKWLFDETTRSEWNRNVKRLLPIVERALGR